MRWGLVATILSPTVDVLRFVAFHLDAGAHRLYIYLDDPDAEVHDILKAHSKIRVQKCNDAYWKKLGAKRPAKHQVRQTANATRAYNRKVEVDWLTHIDVDEFIVPDQRIDEILERCPTQSFARACAQQSCWWAQLISSKPLFPTDQIEPDWLKICNQSLAALLKAGFLAMLQESILYGQESTAWRCAFTTSFKGLKATQVRSSCTA